MEGYYLKLKAFILYGLSYSHVLTLHYNSFKGRLSSFIFPKGINTPPTQIRGLLWLLMACKLQYNGYFLPGF